MAKTLDPLTGRSVIGSGSSRNDAFNGSADHDILDGGGGNDRLSAGGGRDHVLGGSGDDVVDGGDGRDIVRGGSGDDYVRGGAGDDFLYGDSGNDHIVGDEGWDRLFGGSGNDFLEGGGGEDVIVGGKGDDLLSGGAREDHFVYLGNDGNDVILDFKPGEDFIDLRLLPEAITFSDLNIADVEGECGVMITHEALGGSIELRGCTASELSASDFKMPDGETTKITIDGAWIVRPSDTYDGSDAAVLYINGEGDGTAFAKGGQDRVFGGEGDDHLDGGSGADAIYGEEGNDIIDGGYGPDRLFGGEGDDELRGGARRLQRSAGRRRGQRSALRRRRRRHFRVRPGSRVRLDRRFRRRRGRDRPLGVQGHLGLRGPARLGLGDRCGRRSHRPRQRQDLAYRDGRKRPQRRGLRVLRTARRWGVRRRDVRRAEPVGRAGNAELTKGGPDGQPE